MFHRLLKVAFNLVNFVVGWKAQSNISKFTVIITNDPKQTKIRGA